MRNSNNYGYFFILPFFILFFVFSLYPIIYTFILSLNEYDGMADKVYVGFKNYKTLIGDHYFWMSIKSTWRIWLVNIIPQVGVALWLAAVFTFNRIKGQAFFRAFFYLPNLVTAASIALLFNVLLDWQNGVINQALYGLGLVTEKINWLRMPSASQNWVAFIQFWMWYGQTTILLLAGMSAIPTSYYEAAIADGANKTKIFFFITLPLLRPTMIYVIITSMIGGMQIFDIPMVLTDGRGAPEYSLNTMVIYLYNQAFTYNNMGFASAIAYGIFMLIAVFSFIVYFMIQRKEDN
ncbi:MAG: sugar ABC transporter permease [Spirochaetes bacterium]|nr:sugar ABC transporter permease [Spirochaetota bacterium]MBN2772332.1 sugar ABC transporter permease [Spirochaetota bacterium]HRX15784.1 sugar ABC transporter permease [Spirochaetota bacterium]